MYVSESCCQQLMTMHESTQRLITAFSTHNSTTQEQMQSNWVISDMHF